MRIDCCGNLYTGLLLCNIANLRYVQTKIEGIIKEKPMAEKKKVLYIVEAMGGGVFTYIVDLANELVNSYDMYIAYAKLTETLQMTLKRDIIVVRTSRFWYDNGML